MQSRAPHVRMSRAIAVILLAVVVGILVPVAARAAADAAAADEARREEAAAAEVERAHELALQTASDEAQHLDPQAETVSVTFKNGDATVQTITQTVGSAWQFPASPAPATDYYFSGWYTQPDKGGVRFNALDKVTSSAPTTLYAQYGKAEYFYVLVDDTDGDGIKDHMTFTADRAATTGRTLGTDYYRGFTNYDFNFWSGRRPQWNQANSPDRIRKVTFDASFKDVQPTSINGWFMDFQNEYRVYERLTEFENFAYLDTSRCKNFANSFRGLESLTKIDVSSLDTSAAEYMDRAFFSNKSVESINLSGWRMNSVVALEYMFNDCPKLKTVNMAGATAPAVQNTQYMFGGCSSLAQVDLSGINLSNVTNATNMFYDCSSLKTIIAAEGTNMSGANCTNTFYNNNALVGLSVDVNGVRRTTTFAAKKDTGATYAKVRTATLEGYLTAADSNSSYGITYHYNADGLDLSSGVRCMKYAVSGTYPTVASALWSRMGYHATGWNTAPDGSGTTCGFAQQLTSDICDTDLYLQWEANTYSVRFDANGGVGSPAAVADVAYATGQVTMPASADVTREGYDLLGWALTPTATQKAYDIGGSYGQLSAVHGDELTLYAVWQAQTHTVTFDGNVANGGTTYSKSMAETFDSAYALPSPNPTPASGYYFSGWYTAPVGGQRITATNTVKITAPTTFYAQYIKDQTFYVLADDTDGDGERDLLTFTADQAATSGRTLNVDYFTGNTTKMYDLVGGQSDSSKYASWNKPETGLKITKVRFDQSFKTVQPRSISGWFANRFNVGDKNFERLSSFENFEYLDTSKTESFACAFRDLPALATLDLSSMDTSAALDMNRAFYNESVSTSTLRSVNISGWKMDNVTTMASMFVNCAALTDLNMSGATASALAAADHMFENCRSLQIIDLSGFDLSHVTTTNRAFSGCSKLKTILVAEGTDMTGVTDNERTYYGCSNLVGKYYNAAGGVSGQRAFTSAEVGATYSKACTPANDGYLTPATRFNSYSVTYHMNDGGMDVSSTSTSLLHSIVGTYPTVANALWTREGYHSLSWNTVAAPTEQRPGQAVAFGAKLPATLEPAANSGIDLYLQWAPNTYSVQFDANGGTTSAVAMSDVPYEDARILPDAGTVHRDGYTFAGWALTPTATTKAYSGGEEVSKISSIDKDTVTLYAVWTGPNAYKVTFDANVDNGGSSVTETEGFNKVSDTQLTKDERYSENFVLPQDPVAREGYKFSGWYTKPTDGVRVSGNMADFFTEPSTLYAQYIKETEFYAVMKDNDNNGVKDQLIFTTDLTAYPGETYFTASSTASYGGLDVNLPPWNARNYYIGYDGITANIRKVTFDPTFKDVQPYSLYGWFLNRHWIEDDLTRNRENFKDLTTFENFEYLDTSRTVNFESSFRGLTAITSLDLTKLNTTAATTTSRMFLGCTNIKEANISGWNMLNNRSVSFMFNMCSKLETVNMSGVKAPAVKDMSYMFGFNQENQSRTDLGNSPRLKSLDLSGFDLSTVENAYNAFYGCTDLETILCADTTSVFNNPNMMNVKPTVSKEGATGYWDIFSGCNKLVGKYYSPAVVKTTKRTNLPSTLQDGFYLRDSARYGRARSLTEDGLLTPLTKFNSFDIVYHMNAEDGSDATQVSSAPVGALGAGYAKVASGLWSNPGFKPVSWNTKPDGSGATYEFGQAFTATDEPAANESIHLYLQWKPNTYYLTLDANGGSGSVNSKEYGYNNSEAHGFTDEITLPIWSKGGIYRDGYELLGWSLSKTKTTPDEGFEAGAKVSRLTKVDGDTVTLYAIWKVRSYTATLDLNGADGAWAPPAGFAPVAGAEGVYEKSNVDFATTVSLASPSRSGYAFAGWKVTDAEGTAVKTIVAETGDPRALIMGSGDATVTAAWKVTPPVATAGLVYNGEAQTVMGAAPGHTVVSVEPSGATTSTSGYGVSASGEAFLTDAGTYAITVSLSQAAKAVGATWDDGTTSDRVIEATVDRLGIGSAQISVPDVTFTGFEQRPRPTVTYAVAGATHTLQEGVDYTLSWSNNVHAADKSDASAPTVTVTATPTSNVAYGNTQGQQSATFTIDRRDLAEPGEGAQVTFAAIPDQIYTGAALQPAPTVSLVSADGTYTLPPADFQASWASNVNVTDAAEATATATDAGDFSGSATATFKIVPADISRAAVTLNSATGAYDFEGTALALPDDIAVASATLDYDGDNVPDALAEGTDFTASLAAADGSPIAAITAVSSYNVALTGTGNFTGVALAPVTVVPRHYDVTFDANGGSFAGATAVTLDETYDSAYALPAPAPTLPGLSFAGWWTKSPATAADPYGEATGADWGENVTATTVVGRIEGGATTLYARWSRDSFAATFSADHGVTLAGTAGILDDTGTTQVEYGRSVPAGIGVETGSYTFLGWSYSVTEADGTVRTGTVDDYATVAVTGHASFTARLVETTFVAATATDGLVGVGAGAMATASSASAESLATVEGQRVAFAPVNENYELASVTVTDLAAPGEQAHAATVAPGATSFDLGGKAYACSWAMDGGDAGTLTLGAPGEEGMSLTVSFAYAVKSTTFSVRAYKQDVDLDEDASTYQEDASMAYVSGAVEAGSAIEVTPADTEGFTFSYAVVENPATANTSTARHDGATIVSLYYTRDTYAYTATFKDGAGATLAPATSGTAAYGATLGLKGATPAPKVALEAPTVAGFGPATAATITVGADEKSNVLAVTYAEAAYAVTVDPNGGAWSQPGFTRQPDGTYKRDADLAYRSTQALDAPTRDGYSFAGWQAAGASAAVSGGTLTQGTEASVVTATWTVAVPAATTRTYDGTAQVVVAAGEGYELAIAPKPGTTAKADGASATDAGALATHAGTYEVTATLRAGDRNVTWADGTTAPKVVSATVERATNTWTASPACASVTYGGELAPSATPRFPLEGATVTWDFAATAAGPFSTDAPTEVGTYVARATVAETDDYAGLTGTAPFAIGQLALTGANVDAIAEQGYTGSALTPPVTVRDGARVLANGTDYTVTYESNVDVGANTAVAVVRGVGNYAGTVRKSFSIGRAPIAKPTASALTYNGSTQVGVAVATGYTLEVTEAPAAASGYGVYWLDGTEIGSAYFTTAGTYAVVATPDANHRWDDGATDPVTLFVTVAPFDISAGELAEVAPLTYTGEAQLPAPALLVDYTGDLVDDQVNEGRDYTLSWAGNTDAGDATVTATGTGNFTGTTSRTFRIEPVHVTLRAEVASGSSSSKTYDKVAGEPTYSVEIAGLTEDAAAIARAALAPTVRRTDVAGNPTTSQNADTYVMWVSHNDDPNYDVTVENGTYIIYRRLLTVTPNDKSIVFGDALPTLTGTVSGTYATGDTAASIGLAYACSTEADAPVGTYAGAITATIADPNYELATTPGTLAIQPRPLTDAAVTAALDGSLEGSTYVYTFAGEPIRSVASASIAAPSVARELTSAEGADFTAQLLDSGGNPVEAIGAAGTYTVRLTGTNNFTGTRDLAVRAENLGTMATFDANGGTFAGGAATQAVAQEYTAAWSLPAEPTRSYTKGGQTFTYTFGGWHTKNGATDGDWGQRITTSTTCELTADATLYARWDTTLDKKPYRVDHYVQELDAAGAPAWPETPTATDEATGLPGDDATYVRRSVAGHTFDASRTTYADSAHTTAQADPLYVAEDGTTVVSLYYAIDSYPVTWVNDGATFATSTAYYGSTAAAPAATPERAPGRDYSYEFARWADESGNDFDNPHLPVTGAITYHAEYTATPRTYTVTVDANGGELAPGQAAERSLAFAATLDLPDPTCDARGWAFDGWAVKRVGDEGDVGTLAPGPGTTTYTGGTADVRISAKWRVPVPVAASGLAYDASEQQVVAASGGVRLDSITAAVGSDNEGSRIDEYGNAVATHAGDYSVTAEISAAALGVDESLLSWADGTSAPHVVAAAIARASNQVTGLGTEPAAPVFGEDYAGVAGSSWGSDTISYAWGREGTRASFGASKPTAAGTWLVRATVPEGDDWEAAEATAAFQILPATLENAVVASAPATYNAFPQEPATTVTVGGKALVAGRDYVLEYYTDEALANRVEASDMVAAGTYWVKAVGVGNYATQSEGDPAAEHFKAGTYQIMPAELTLSAQALASRPYDATTDATAQLDRTTLALSGAVAGEAPTLDASAARAALDSPDVGGRTATITGVALASGNPANANYRIAAGEGGAQATAEATVTPALLTVTGIAATPRAYDGTTAVAVTGTPAISGGVVGSEPVTIDATAALSATLEDTGAGTGRVATVSGLALADDAAAANVNRNYAFATTTLSVDIARAQLTVASVSVVDKTYDGTTTASADPASATFAGAVSGETPTLDASVLSAVFSSPRAGTDVVVAVSGLALDASDPTNANYELLSSSVGATASILKATLTATYAPASHGTFGEQMPTDVAVTGFVGGEDATTALGYSAPTVDTSTATHAGTYALTPEGGTADDYAFAYAEGTLVVDPNPNSWVTPAGVNPTSLVFGDTYEPVGEARYQRDGEPSFEYSTVPTFSPTSTTTVKPTAAGHYYVRASVAATSDWLASRSVGEFDIAPATFEHATVTCETTTYTGSAQQATVKVRIGQQDPLSEGTDYELSCWLDETCTTPAPAGGPTDAGTYWVRATGKGNYAGSSAVGSFTIAPAELTITGGVSVATRPYDATTAVASQLVTVAEGGPTFTGAIAGEAPTLDWSAVAATLDGADAGTREARVSGIALAAGNGANRNYAIAADEAGTQLAVAGVEVSRRELTLAGVTAVARDYDGTTAVELDLSQARLDGAVPGETPVPDFSAVTGALPDAGAGEARSVAVAGATLADAAVNANYAIAADGSGTQATVPVTVRPKAVTVTCDAKSKSFGDADPELTGSVSGLVDTESLVGLAYGRDAGEHAGNHRIFAIWGENPNYAVTLVESALTIAPADLSTGEVRPISDQTYTGSELEPVPTVTWVDSQGSTHTLEHGVDFTLAYESNVNVGTAHVTVTGTGDYSAALSATFQVVPAEARIPSALTGLVFDGTSQLGVDFDDALCVAEGERATDAGEHVATIRLADPANTSWADGTAAPVSVAYSIGRADVSRAAIDPIPDQVATGRAVEPDVYVSFAGMPLVEGRDYELSFERNVRPGTAVAVVDGRGNFAGSASATFRVTEAVRALDVYRMYNPNSGEHFYTLAAGERDALVAAGWAYEGVGWRAPSAGDPVHRLYNPYTGDHHYTPSSFERDALVGYGWRYEGVSWCSDAQRRVPLYRDYNPNARVGTHNYTASAHEHQALVSMGWVAEGVSWYGV